MKFSSQALLATLALAASASVVQGRKFNSQQIQNLVEKSNKQALLRHARKLEGDDNEEEEGWQITGEYSVKFNECLSLTMMVEEEEEEDEDNEQQQQNMQDIQPTADYVILDVINSNDGSISNYAVDLATFVTTLSKYIPERQEDYCEACDYDYCYPNANNDADAQEDGEEQEDEDREDGENDRKLANNSDRIVSTDCTVCESLNCFQDEDEQADDGQLTQEDALEWLNEVGECQAIDEDNYNYNNNNNVQLYAGFTCNAAGTGMEIGVFQDEDCSQLTGASFQDVIANGGAAASYQEMTKGLVQRVFVQYFDCMDTQYVNPGEDQDEDENQDEDEDEFQANEYCEELVSEDAVAMGESCIDENADEDEDKYGYDENGNPWGQYQDAYGNIIYYDIQDAEDAEQVCIAIQNKNGNYQTTTSTSGGGNSNLYDYNSGLDESDGYDWDTGKEGQNDNVGKGSGNGWWSNTKNKMGETYSNLQQATGLSSGEFAGAIVGAVLLLVGVCVVGCKLCNREKKASLDLDEVENSRREPLVNNPEVYIA